MEFLLNTINRDNHTLYLVLHLPYFLGGVGVISQSKAINFPRERVYRCDMISRLPNLKNHE